MTECPNCKRDITSRSISGEEQILCTLKNEGGVQKNLDILPILTEEMYLKAYPEERKSQAFLEFCGEGDIEAIVDILRAEGEEDEEKNAGVDYGILQYQDQIHTMNSGLHVAIQNQRAEVAWLLLLLASTLDISALPPQVINAAENFDLRREDGRSDFDIRGLRDNEGKTAEERATEVGGIWTDWLRTSRLKPNT